VEIASDSIGIDATAAAQINTEVDTALNTAIPGSPTPDSINERVATMDTSGVKLGNVAHGGAAATLTIGGGTNLGHMTLEGLTVDGGISVFEDVAIAGVMQWGAWQIGSDLVYALASVDSGATAVSRLTSAQAEAAAAEAIAAAGLTAPGGTFAQTVTVTTGTPAVPVQGATVEIREADGTLVDIQTTNASGVATPTCDAGTYSLVVSKSSLYASSTASITVTAAEARAVTLSAISFTASTRPGTVTVRWTVIDDADYLPCGAGEGTMQIRMKTAPTTDGFAWGKDARSATTDATGVAQFADVPLGCTLLAKLGASTSGGEWFEVSVPSDATSPYDAGEILGSVP
jgi:hypothetical protein